MIEIRFEEREKIGLQYILESLHGCSPFGQERIRRLRYYTPDEREELEQELRNVERAAAHAGDLKDLYDQICVVLCQMKDIRGSLRRCRELEVPDHVELFELKGYLQRLETLRPLFEKLRDTAGLTGLASTIRRRPWPSWTRKTPAAGTFTFPMPPPPDSGRSAPPKSRWRSSCTGPDRCGEGRPAAEAGTASAPRRTARR